MSDGAAFVLIMSEELVKELNLEPVARLVNYAAAGVPPRIMGIGPVAAVPKALKQAGLKQNDIELIELNEAFASQSLAVIRELKLDQALKLAKKKIKDGEYEEAKAIYEDILKKFSKSRQAESVKYSTKTATTTIVPDLPVNRFTIGILQF